MNILGFSGIANGDYYRENFGLRFVGHDSSVALVLDGKVVFAVEEERLSREKHTSRFPVQALDAALRHTGLRLGDVERAAYTWYASPGRIAHMFTHHAFRVPLPHWSELALAGTRVILDLMWPGRIAHQFGSALGSPLPHCEGVSHHMGHSACAYFTSPFDHAAVLTVDGQGEDESGSLGEWRGTEYRHFRSIYSPDSIGILYGMVTDFLGMRAAWDEYKVMGMAAYGDPERFAPAFRKLVTLRPDGRYRTYRTAMVFKPGYCDRMLSGLLGIPKRGPDEPLGQVHFDVAASLQQTTEDVLFHLLRYLRQRTNSTTPLPGRRGLSEQRGQRQDPPERPVRESARPVRTGRSRRGIRGRVTRLSSAFRCPATGRRVHRVLRARLQRGGHRTGSGDGEGFHRLPALRAHSEDAAEFLAQDKIIGWFQGRMEYGPRALGHRSILANPSKAEHERYGEREDQTSGAFPAFRRCSSLGIRG